MHISCNICIKLYLILNIIVKEIYIKQLIKLGFCLICPMVIIRIYWVLPHQTHIFHFNYLCRTILLKCFAFWDIAIHFWSNCLWRYHVFDISSSFKCKKVNLQRRVLNLNETYHIWSIVWRFDYNWCQLVKKNLKMWLFLRWLKSHFLYST